MVRELDDHDIITHLKTSIKGDCMSAFRRYSIAAACVCSVSQGALAGDWKSGYGVNVREVFTDNVCLSEDNKKSEFITTVTPNFSIKGSSGRAKLNVYGAMEVNNLTDSNKCSSNGGNDDNLNPRLSGNGTVELVSNLLYIDGTANIQQNSINPFEPSGDSNLNRNDNRNTTYDYSVSPYLIHRFSDVAKLNVRYTYDDQENSESAVGNSDQQSVFASLTSLPGWSKLSWGLQGNYQKVSYDEDSSTPDQQDELSSVSFNLGYQINRKWKIFGSVGDEFNDFETVNDETEGNIWSAGFEWTPNPRTRVLMSAGERFFDNTPKVSISHRLKHSQFSLEYEKTLTFTRNLRTEPEFFPIVDQNGDPILDQNGELILIGLNQTTLTRSPVVDERLKLGYRWSRGRTAITVDGTSSEQTREEDGYSSTFTTVGVGVRRDLTPHMNVNARISYTDTSVASGSEVLGSDSNVVRVYLGLTKKISEKTSLSVTYAFSDRDADSQNSEYTENRITVGIGMRW